MPPLAVYRFELYQINVSQDVGGDCAIMLLINTAMKVSGKSRVEWAALIDGGDGTGCTRFLIKTMQGLEEKYAFEGGDKVYSVGAFKFDVVSISHWDQDHWAGFCEHYTTGDQHDFLHDPAYGFEEETEDQNHGQHKAFKYDVTTDPENSIPKTKLYCQDWDKGSSGRSLNQDSVAKRVDPVLCPMNVKAIPRGVAPQYKHVIAGRLKTKAVLGYNLISGEGIPAMDKGSLLSNSNIKSIVDLVKHNHPWKFARGAPGLYVWSVDRQALGDPTLGVFEYSFTAKSATNPNPASMMLLLVWVKDLGTDQDAQMADPQMDNITISMYSGGDAEYGPEEKLTTWLKSYTDNGGIIQVVKAGHHGSSAGTSQEFIEAVKPDLYIVSNGIKHFHPRPEVLFYMHAYFSKHPPTITLPKRIWMVAWPYWLAKVLTNDGNIRWMLPKDGSDALVPEMFDTAYTDEDTDAEIEWKALRDKINGWYTDLAATNSEKNHVKVFSDTLEQIRTNKVPGKNYLTDNDKNIAMQLELSQKMADLLHDLAEPRGMSYPLKATFATSEKPNPKDRHFNITQNIKITFDADGKVTGSPVMTDYKDMPNDFVYPTVEWEFPEAQIKPKEAVFLFGVRSGVRKFTPVEACTRSDRVFMITEAEEAQIWKMDQTSSVGGFSSSLPPRIPLRGTSLPTASPSVDGPVSLITIAPDADAKTLLPGSNLYNFVGHLHGQRLEFSEKVPVDSAKWEYRLKYGNEFASWIANIFYSSSTVTTTTDFKVWKNNTNNIVVDGFRADVANFCGSHWMLVWKSENVLSQLALGVGAYQDRKAVMDAVEFGGFVKDTGILIMGLDIRYDPKNPSLSYRSNSAGNASEHFMLSNVLQLVGLLNVNEGKTPFPAAFSTILDNVFLDTPLVTDWETKQDTQSDAVQALWFVPGFNYETTLRVDFVESGRMLADLLERALFNETTVDPVKVIAIRNAQHQYGPGRADGKWALLSTGKVCFKATMKLPKSSSETWNIFVSLDESSVTFVLRWPSTSNPLTDFLKWIDSKLAGLLNSFNSFRQILQDWSGDNNVLSNILLREVRLVVDWSQTSPTLVSASLTLQLNLKWGIDSITNTNSLVPFQLRFSYSKGNAKPVFEFTGSLWQDSTTSPTLRLDPSAPIEPPLLPARLSDSSKSYAYVMKLDQLGADGNQMGNKIPQGIPNEIAALSLDIRTDSIVASATLATAGSTNQAPALSLSSVDLSAGLTWTGDSKNRKRTVDLKFFAGITLSARPSYDIEPAGLRVAITYDKPGDAASNWVFAGSAVNLTGAHLYSLLPSTDSDGVFLMLKDLFIRELTMQYNYSSGGVGTSFQAGGFLSLGPVDLQIDFKMPENKLWAFKADMSWVKDVDVVFEPPSSTLGLLVSSICPGVRLPDFIGAIFTIVDINAKLDLTVRKLSSNRIMLSLDASVSVDEHDSSLRAEFTYIQLSPELGGNVAAAEPIRILKFEINSLPSLPNIPMLDKFEQPFDQWGFMWCNSDLSRDIVDSIINPNVFNNDPKSKLVYRDPRKFTSSTDVLKSNQKDDIVYLKGSHVFVVIEENSVPTAIVDYQFNATKPPPNAGPTALAATDDTDDQDADEGTNKGGASGVLQKTVGPLTVSGLTLKYGESNLGVTFDAIVKLGGLEGSLKGFGVEFELRNVFQFHNLSTVTLLIDGVGLGMNEPPVSLAGEVIKKTDDFFGGVSLGIVPYDFMGGGFYGSAKRNDGTKDPDNSDSTFHTIFVFAKIAGPFVELEFASLTNLVAGFGHNSHMTLPTVDNVTTFPFLAFGDATSAPGKNPLDVLNTLTTQPPSPQRAWFAPLEGEMWMAAALVAKAFHSLTVNAVLTADFTDSDVVVGLFAHAEAKVPPEAPDNEAFALVDMGLLALLDWSKGIFKVEGQLTPKSFILSQDCKLKGGFALCYFFEGSGHDGDWVFSIGGYHPSFAPPTWYPVPQRVGINWILDSSISISGEAYFAVTPKCCMGGGKLDLVFTSGSLHAWFSAYADFLVNYSPFSFQAAIGISIGIDYTLQVAFITHHFHLGFGCSLHIHGPPVAGYVTVGWSILSFDIYFGNANETSQRLTWLQFQDLIRQDGIISSPQSANAPPSLLKASATNGLVSSPNSDPETQMVTQKADPQATPPVVPVWNVNHAIFTFDITTIFPITLAQLNGSGLNLPTTFKDAFGADKPLGDVSMKPMQAKQNVTSALSVSIKDQYNNYVAFVPAVLTKNLPTALWNKYNGNDDPYTSKNVSASSFTSTDSTKPLMIGLSFSVPLPKVTAPKLAMNTSTDLAFDCYKDTNHPRPRLPSDSSGNLRGVADPLVPLPTTYQNASQQTGAFNNAAQVWRKSQSDELARVLAGLAEALGVPKESERATKMGELAKKCKPPARVLANMQSTFVVPPLVTTGAV